MNVLRISKGDDIRLSVDGELLCFVTDFSAKEISETYEIEEFLSDTIFDEVKLLNAYEIVITALNHLHSSVFNTDGFTLTAELGDEKYEYVGCRLKEVARDVNGNKPLVNKYRITAKKLVICEVQYG